MMNRRTWLQSSTLLAAGATLGTAQAAAARGTQKGDHKPLIVMVHGGFHWGGCFGKVANLLAQNGYPVATPDNRSHGYEATPYNAIKDMADYCAPVERIVAAAKSPVVLLGHSLGGVTLTYLGEKYPEKIRRLIYLTAIMCPNGESFASYMTPERSVMFAFPPLFDGTGPSDGVMLKVSDPAVVRSAFYADCSDHDFRIAMANVNPINSLIPLQFKSAITPRRFGSIPRAYIETSEDRTLVPKFQRQFQADVPGATVRTLATSHSPFFSQPEALANLIMQLA